MKITLSVLLILVGVSLLGNVIQFRNNQRATSEVVNSELNSAFNLINMSSESIDQNTKLASTRLAGAVSIFYLLQTPLAKAGVDHTSEVAVALNAADMEIAFPSGHSPQEIESMKAFVQASARDGSEMLQAHISMAKVKTVMNKIYKDIPQTKQ